MIDIQVCIGSACHLKGSYNIINKLQNLIEERDLGDSITVKAALCLGSCSGGVSVSVDEGPVIQVNEKDVVSFFDEYVMKDLNEELY